MIKNTVALLTLIVFGAASIAIAITNGTQGYQRYCKAMAAAHAISTPESIALGCKAAARPPIAHAAEERAI